MPETQYKSIRPKNGEPVTRSMLNQLQNNLNWIKEQTIRIRYTHEWFDFGSLKKLNTSIVNDDLMVMSGTFKVPDDFDESSSRTVKIKFPKGFSSSYPPMVTTGIIANIPQGDSVVGVALSKNTSAGAEFKVTVFDSWSTRKKTITTGKGKSKKTKTLYDKIPDGIHISWMAIGKKAV